MTPLEYVRQKAIEANPLIMRCVYGIDTCKNTAHYEAGPIQIADILLAFQNTKHWILVSKNGTFHLRGKNPMVREYTQLCEWDLTKNLSEQSLSTITSIATLLGWKSE